MEWTRESLRGTYILVKSRTHAKKIIKFYESFGFQNKITKTPEIGWYICAVDFTSQDGVLLADVICYKRTKGMEEIVLQTKPRRKFPREMMVSDDGVKWERKTIAGKVKSEIPYVLYIAKEDLNAIIGIPYPRCWKYAKEID